jgi:two-component system, CAI-1 autoinducer sensor kinase/phosphatase CqsS
VRSDFRFRGSPMLFAQVIDNLIKNALRSVAQRGESPQPGDVLLEIDGSGDPGRIAVTDRGMGIAPMLQDRIFQPFFTSQGAPGHGLGLAFCRRVVHEARGRITVQSAPAQGATFTIELPVAH